MSKLSQPNGDDHPEAAGKHLNDASTLATSGRPDGAAYLAGYVVECCLKTLMIVENGTLKSHDFALLANRASALSASAGAKTAKYVSDPVVKQLSATSIAVSWRPELRYRAPGHISDADAKTWVQEATAVYDATIIPMKLDGIL